MLLDLHPQTAKLFRVVSNPLTLVCLSASSSRLESGARPAIEEVKIQLIWKRINRKLTRRWLNWLPMCNHSRISQPASQYSRLIGFFFGGLTYSLLDSLYVLNRFIKSNSCLSLLNAVRASNNFPQVICERGNNNNNDINNNNSASHASRVYGWFNNRRHAQSFRLFSYSSHSRIYESSASGNWGKDDTAQRWYDDISVRYVSRSFDKRNPLKDAENILRDKMEFIIVYALIRKRYVYVRSSLIFW